ncbi:MAG: methyltransferase domain-containing protein [Candidatus Taylorbacteria bacterium]|nr:methyltransferase domain-containing protein [Candidatus Taylorbacteria bacterium]
MKQNSGFWNKEYKQGNHLALSDNPSEDLIKFTRWIERESGREFLNVHATALDLGCGNGRNLIYLAKQFGIRGIGYDSSKEAIVHAKQLSLDLPIVYETRSIAGNLPVPDESQTFVLDMMTSHFLDATEREHLITEIARVLKPGGWLFWKTFLQDGDMHAKKLLREHPAEEDGSYIHPRMHVAEHVFTEEEVRQVLSYNFTIHKITKSHRHRDSGRAGKRRSMSIYAERNY